VKPTNTLFAIRCPHCNAVWGEVNVEWASPVRPDQFTRRDGTKPEGRRLQLAADPCPDCGRWMNIAIEAQLKAHAWANRYRQQRALHSMPPSHVRH